MEKLRSRDENCNDEKNPRVFISKDIREIIAIMKQGL